MLTICLSAGIRKGILQQVLVAGGILNGRHNHYRYYRYLTISPIKEFQVVGSLCNNKCVAVHAF